jgi:hypothetical protein
MRPLRSGTNGRFWRLALAHPDELITEHRCVGAPTPGAEPCLVHGLRSCRRRQLALQGDQTVAQHAFRTHRRYLVRRRDHRQAGGHDVNTNQRIIPVAITPPIVHARILILDVLSSSRRSRSAKRWSECSLATAMAVADRVMAGGDGTSGVRRVFGLVIILRPW